MTRLPIIESLHVLAFIAYTSSALAFVSTEVGFIISIPLLYYLILPFFCLERKAPIFLDSVR